MQPLKCWLRGVLAAALSSTAFPADYHQPQELVVGTTAEHIQVSHDSESAMIGLAA